MAVRKRVVSARDASDLRSASAPACLGLSSSRQAAGLCGLAPADAVAPYGLSRQQGRPMCQKILAHPGEGAGRFALPRAARSDILEPWSRSPQRAPHRAARASDEENCIVSPDSQELTRDPGNQKARQKRVAQAAGRPASRQNPSVRGVESRWGDNFKYTMALKAKKVVCDE